jgi:hypothetical protein
VTYCDTPATLRLELTDSAGNVVNSLDLMDDNNAYRVSSFELAWPAVREVKAALPTRDGAWDTTQLLGERVVTIMGAILTGGAQSRQSAMNVLAYWATPALRPRLVYAVDQGNPLAYIGLRGQQLGAPFSDKVASMFTVSWVAPDPVAYAMNGQRLVIYPGVRASGRTYSLTYPRHYAISGPGSYGAAVNYGSYQSWPVFKIYGPCTDPVIDYVGASPGLIVFKGLTIAAGDYVVVDTRAASVLYNGQVGASRYYLLDFTQTVWAPFQPGMTGILFVPASSSGACYLEVDWSDAYLT